MLKRFLLLLVAMMVTSASSEAIAQLGTNPESHGEDWTTWDGGRWSTDLTAPFSSVGRELYRADGGGVAGQMRIENRGYLWLDAQFHNGGQFAWQWTWRDRGGQNTYKEVSTFVLNSNRKVQTERPWGPADALTVSVNWMTGKVSVDHAGKNPSLLKSAYIHVKDGKVVVTKMPPDVKVAVPPGTWLDMHVNHTVRDIKVNVNRKDVLKVGVPAHFAERPSYIGWSGREVVGPRENGKLVVRTTVVRRYRFTAP